ncbi:Alpha/Beta hydrolase protein [Armillaria mellea]|nr:Alpha/Beta hydrolase protein [Armillaria mellea]
MTFVEGVPSCSSLVRTSLTVDCLQSANSSAVLEGFLRAMEETDEQLPIRHLTAPMFAQLPFIAGTNLDEGTLFFPPNVLDDFLALYPDDPAAGSPYNTGNETFGLSPIYKKCAALRSDLMFDSQRRVWIQTTSEVGVKAFGYRFTQPLSATPAYLGVYRGSEIPFVYGTLGSLNETASAKSLSVMMMDYWLSFATSLDPNDGLGSARPLWPQYTPNQQISPTSTSSRAVLKGLYQVLLQLNGGNLTVIPDDYNKEKIDFIISEGSVFRHRR